MWVKPGSIAEPGSIEKAIVMRIALFVFVGTFSSLSFFKREERLSLRISRPLPGVVWRFARYLASWVVGNCDPSPWLELDGELWPAVACEESGPAATPTEYYRDVVMNKIATFSLPGTTVDRRYPDSDGRFMGDTQFHNVAMSKLHQMLEEHFADRADVYIVSNLVFYWDQKDATKRRDPDVLVAKGVASKHKRRSYRLWEEGKIPCTLFEIASRRTWRKDLYEKPALYAGVGIKEYFLFDPEGKYLKPVLQGFRCVKGKPVAMKPARDGSLVSKALGLRLVPEGDLLRLVDLVTGERLLTGAERADRQEQRAEQERELREQEQQRAAQEQQRAEQERQLREHEQQRAEALAAEVERLRRLLPPGSA
jgi:Uma2 family endonuclease